MAFSLRSWVAAAACLGTLTSQVALAAPPGHQAAVADVALADGGLLVGQVLDAQGTPVAQAPVAVRSQGRELLRLAANADGQFAVRGLESGIYEVATPGRRGVYRMWAPNTAPPAAARGVMLVSGGEAVRGQYGEEVVPQLPPYEGEVIPPPPLPPCEQPGHFGKTMGWVSTHPFITAGAVATAIAVPVAVAATDDDDPPAGS